MTCIKNFALNKQSNTQEIRMYFERVLQLTKLDEEFPINLNEVWPLVYSEKGKAVRALKENFIEHIDFQVLAQNGKNSNNGRPTVYYFLSVSCLEYFIARKIRPVFEVYRQVFHNSVATLSIKSISNRKSEKISAESMQRNIALMYDSLFARINSMGLNFSPITRNLETFSWDSCKSVRSNINKFIESYYKNIVDCIFIISELNNRDVIRIENRSTIQIHRNHFLEDMLNEISIIIRKYNY